MAVMDYYEIREIVSKIVPRQVQLISSRRSATIKEKGRKTNYRQFSFCEGKMIDQKRLLNTEVINSFLEISVRAAACPMPFNMDVWDGLICPYGCLYCYANGFRASLYTSFFDNSKTIGLRHCDPSMYMKEMDKMAPLKDLPFEEKRALSGVRKAFALGIPVRLGIRFEDFLANERRTGVSLSMLRYLADINHPVMVNTKSALIGEDPYVEALARNRAGAAVHVTVIGNDDRILRRIEPGAPSYQSRLNAMRNLVSAGVRCVARIEPFLFLVNDDREAVDSYIEDMTRIGVRNITFDTYSYTGTGAQIRQSFYNVGIDFDRIFLAGADSQPLGSLLLGEFMKLFRERGFSCSTFDMGNVPDNDQDVCCEVGDLFGQINHGCSVMASRFIRKNEGRPVRWADFEAYVEENGGFLSKALQSEVHRLWNCEGNYAYSHSWSIGMDAVGSDEGGLVWMFRKDYHDYRRKMLEAMI